MAAKKEAKMGHHVGKGDTGRKSPVPCKCGGLMQWSKVGRSMRFVCESCGTIT